MPELPEVETVCAGLKPALEGQKLVGIKQRRKDLRFPLPTNFVSTLSGKIVKMVRRRAKFILIHLDGGFVLMIHLGMSGRITIYPNDVPPAGRHDHIEFITDKGITVRYCDPRRFGFMDLVSASSYAEHPMISHLGPEPLTNDFDVTSLNNKLGGRKIPIKNALLDQRVVAGLGNIYVCEALFKARISPKRIAHSVPGQRSKRLVAAIKEVLHDAIIAGGSSLKDFTGTDGNLGYFQTHWAVYGRAGEKCRAICSGPHRRWRCEHVIKRIVQSGRSTFYCSKCQR